MQPEPKKHVSHWLAWSIIILAVGATAYGVWYYSKQINSTYDCCQLPQKSADETTADATAADATADWKTYTNDDYGISFKYPKALPELIKKSMASGRGTSTVKQDVYEASEKDPRFVSIIISNTSDYPITNTHEQATIQALKTVYTNKSADSFKITSLDAYSPANTLLAVLPQINADVIANNTPKYIETSDGKYRGVYLFAEFGQDSGIGLRGFVLMTDGQKKIFSLSYEASDVAVGKQYGACYTDNTKCTTSQLDQFATYVKDLDPTTSQEPIVQDFNSYFKLVAQSIKNN